MGQHQEANHVDNWNLKKKEKDKRKIYLRKLWPKTLQSCRKLKTHTSMKLKKNKHKKHEENYKSQC